MTLGVRKKVNTGGTGQKPIMPQHPLLYVKPGDTFLGGVCAGDIFYKKVNITRPLVLITLLDTCKRKIIRLVQI